MSEGTIQINENTDRVNLLLHYGACGAILAGSAWYTGGTKTLISSAVISLLLIPFKNQIQKQLRPNLPVADNLPEGSKRLPAVVRRYSRQLNLSEEPTLQIFESGLAKEMLRIQGYQPRFQKDGSDPDYDNIDAIYAYVREFQEELRKTIQDFFLEFDRKPNAAAYGTTGNYGVFVTNPLMKLLGKKEEEFIVGHEVGHIAAKHMKKMQGLDFIKTTAVLNANLFLLHNYSSLRGLAVAATQIIMSYAATGFLVKHLKYDLRDKENAWRSETRKKEKNNAEKVGRYISTATLLGTSWYVGAPEIFTAWLTSRGTQLSFRLVSRNLSRRFEFQADRIGAGLCQNPKLARSALNKIIGYYEDTEPEKMAQLDYKTGPLPIRWFRRAKTVFKTHPNIERRCERLQQIENKVHVSANATP